MPSLDLFKELAIPSNLAISLPTPEEVAALSLESFGYALPAHQLPVYHALICRYLSSCAGIETDLKESQTPVQGVASLGPVEDQGRALPQEFSSTENRDFTILPASGANNPHGAWTLRCNMSHEEYVIRNSSPASCLPLQGKRVVVKDNIPICGMPMYCGTSFAFTPYVDSPLITRCLKAGATIVGRAQCEYMCASGASHTASAGLVSNPLAVEYHAGGSSSGCAVLVAVGEADLAVGTDQGGSCRIPSAINGLVACKPTHGLVPYTLIDGMYGPIDHAGPITRTVEDNALMLGVLAGWDGVDERANVAARQWKKKTEYCAELKMGVKGMRIGVVKEGFTVQYIEEDVVAASQAAAKLLQELGAVVEEVSVPLHSKCRGIRVMYGSGKVVERLFWGDDQAEDVVVGVDDQGKQWHRREFLREQLLENVGSWSVIFRVGMMGGEWLRQRHPEAAQAGEVYKQRLIQDYEAALSKYEVLLMPTIPVKATKLPPHLSTASNYQQASAELVAAHSNISARISANTTALNVTGHPAVCLPVGRGVLSEATTTVTTDSTGAVAAMALPLSVMLVGRYFQEGTLYRVAYALQEAQPWRSLLYCGARRLDIATSQASP